MVNLEGGLERKKQTNWIELKYYHNRIPIQSHPLLIPDQIQLHPAMHKSRVSHTAAFFLYSKKEKEPTKLRRRQRKLITKTKYSRLPRWDNDHESQSRTLEVLKDQLPGETRAGFPTGTTRKILVRNERASAIERCSEPRCARGETENGGKQWFYGGCSHWWMNGDDCSGHRKVHSWRRDLRKKGNDWYLFDSILLGRKTKAQ